MDQSVCRDERIGEKRDLTESLPVNLFLDQAGTIDNSFNPHFIESNNIYHHIKGGAGAILPFFTDALSLLYCNILCIY